jgi:hypothetical protein
MYEVPFSVTLSAAAVRASVRQICSVERKGEAERRVDPTGERGEGRSGIRRPSAATIGLVFLADSVALRKNLLHLLVESVNADKKVENTAKLLACLAYGRLHLPLDHH